MVIVVVEHTDDYDYDNDYDNDKDKDKDKDNDRRTCLLRDSAPPNGGANSPSGPSLAHFDGFRDRKGQSTYKGSDQCNKRSMLWPEPWPIGMAAS